MIRVPQTTSLRRSLSAARFSPRMVAAATVLSLGAPWMATAQTQIDLRTQGKSVDFQSAPSTKTIRVSATLPNTCSPNELLLLSTAPAGSNLYLCLTQDSWILQGNSSGTLTVQNGGVNVGARQTQNFVSGSGLLNVITDLNSKLNIQQGVDTGFIISKPSLQGGSALLCSGPGESAPSFSCLMNPALTAYTSGMVINWIPGGTPTSEPSTLNIDLLGPAPVVLSDGVTPVTAGLITAGTMYQIWYDGSAFRLLQAAASTNSPSGGGVPAYVTSLHAGGATAVTATSEWHSQLAVCAGTAGAVLTWDTPPSGPVPVPGGCSGTNLNDGYAAFAPSSAAAVQTSFILPQELTGKVDIRIYYQTGIPEGTFSPAIGLYCTPTDGSIANDAPFPAQPFFAPGATTSPLLPGSMAVVSSEGLDWPASCTGRARAHLRLSRTDSTGTAQNLNVSEVVLVLRRSL